MNIDPAVVRNGLIFFIILAASLCLRAYAQAWVADRLGDRTPGMEGRLTINPLPHVDFFGTVVLPLIFIFYLQPSLSRQNLFLFLGWAKPVPINPQNFRNPKSGVIFTQFAGMAMGLLLCLFAAIAGGLSYRAQPEAVQVFMALISINSCLIIFDCLPIPPLPGGVLLRQLGYISEETYVNIARWSGLALIVLINIRPCMIAFVIVQQLIAWPFVLILQGLAH